MRIYLIQLELKIVGRTSKVNDIMTNNEKEDILLLTSIKWKLYEGNCRSTLMVMTVRKVPFIAPYL